jgi:hypothetical protein
MVISGIYLLASILLLFLLIFFAHGSPSFYICHIPEKVCLQYRQPLKQARPGQSGTVAAQSIAESSQFGSRGFPESNLPEADSGCGIAHSHSSIGVKCLQLGN